MLRNPESRRRGVKAQDLAPTISEGTCAVPPVPLRHLQVNYPFTRKIEGYSGRYGIIMNDTLQHSG